MLFNMAGGGSAGFDELWKNASSSSSFAAQSFSINTDGYNMFVVVTADGAYLVAYQAVMSYAISYESTATYAYFPSRSVSIHDGKAEFGNCNQYRLGGSSGGLYKEVVNSLLVPYRILGVKGVPAWE